MTTPIDIRDAVASAIAADADLASWVSSRFGDSLTVRKGLHLAKSIQETWFPAVIVAVGSEEDLDAEVARLDLAITVGVDRADLDPALAEESAVLLARKVADLFDAEPNRTLGGLAVDVAVTAVSSDAGGFLPKLYRSVALKVYYES